MRLQQGGTNQDSSTAERALQWRTTALRGLAVSPRGSSWGRGFACRNRQHPILHRGFRDLQIAGEAAIEFELMSMALLTLFSVFNEWRSIGALEMV
jgi:hypothetical protein